MNDPRLPQIPGSLRDDAAVAAPLTAGRYLGLAALLLARTPTAVATRVVRAIVTAGTGAAPAVLIAALAWLTEQEPERRAAGLALAARATDAIAGAGAALATTVVVAVVLRALCDRAAARALSGAASAPGHAPAASLGGHILVALADAGVMMGTLLFASPIVATAVRVGDGGATGGSPGGAALFAALCLVVGWSIARWWSGLLAAYAVWRPGFLPAALAAAVSAPASAWRLHGRLATASVATGVVIQLFGGALGVSAIDVLVDGDRVTPSLLAALLATGLADVVARAWIDAAQLALVGHRLGDCTQESLDGTIQSASPARAPGFEPPREGAFANVGPVPPLMVPLVGSGGAEASGSATDRRVRSDTPGASPTWDVRTAPVEPLTASLRAARTTTATRPESVQRGSGPAAPGSGEPPPDAELRERPPATQSAGEGGLASLTVGRARFRTVDGLPEAVWRGEGAGQR
ncbi:MAG: hypothetical protein H6698_03490 [Myxococcales bacterium]|nr:hypothetical protein [Myxococcales bacterium]MCB9519285.1 hypothetical protein [Myxococcales bacterium]MCB9530729.1 hypothetical protein [Myxococcales bacterium]MCB9533377.1 hypothetical protein [Myxococcales bacterium]